MSNEVPSLAEWAGGQPAFEKLTELFYAKVPDHPVLGPVFAGMNPSHAKHVAAFLTEVFGGPKAYSEIGGSHSGMVAHHFNRSLTEEQRRAWVGLMLDTADEAGLPDDPEFRAAFVGYLEWGTRLAKLNSQPGATSDPSAPMPQ
jgi:hemoglobin